MLNVFRTMLIAVALTGLSLWSDGCLGQSVPARSVAALNVADPQEQVGESRVPTGQLLSPVGEVLSLSGRPNDLSYDPRAKRLLVKNHKALNVVDAQDFTLLQTLDCPGGASLVGIVTDNQSNVFVSNANAQVHVFVPTENREGTMELAASLEMPAGSFPCGLAISPDQSQLYVCLSKLNQVAICDLKSLRELLSSPRSPGGAALSMKPDALAVRTVDVGIAPYDVECVETDLGLRLVVSNIGGRRARNGDDTSPSAGTETPVSKAGIANTSLISVVDVQSAEVVGSVATGLHASEVLTLPKGPAGRTVLVTNTNDDSISLVDLRTLAIETQIAKPAKELPYGSMPNEACLSPDGRWAFVALAGNNAVAVYDLTSDQANTDQANTDQANTDQANTDQANKKPPGRVFENALGFLPTGWFPAGLACSDTHLFVANLKGLGSRDIVRAPEKGRNSHDHLGSLQKVALKDIADPNQLARWTETVASLSKILPNARIDLAQQNVPEEVAAKPIPLRLGEPSVFRHIIYVIKENRTYDQVFGDLAESRSEPSLCVFPEFNTPNHHALARRFGILDNYYCNGVLSADGHSWATEGNVTPYLERAFGGFARSYTFGDDPITYSSSGFLWDRILDAGLSFRNYGEMNYSKPPEGMDYQAIWKAYQAGEKLEFSHEIGIDRLRRYSSPNYPGWNMVIPDVLRMDRFLEEFKQFESDGSLPNLCIVYLPEDHLGGGVTSAAHMADNDLALGRLVEAVSESEYWSNTLIIANEDDPQNGYDHVDGHRSLCLVMSAYSRPGVNHDFFNQTSAIRTMLQIFGLPPLNQQDARSPLMSSCFVEQPNLEPYRALAANVPLNQSPKDVASQNRDEKRWRTVLATVPIERTGMKTEEDENNLNRFVWHEMKGWKTPYPVEWSGSHARGLTELGLSIDLEADD